ncbi:hypothetical protein D6D05_05797 [Aureobasidium pullulans]|nr:hypothetical protein D6D05_05797 [Aureobasidium pullulans]
MSCQFVSLLIKDTFTTMKIQKATSPPPDIILGPANTNMKNAPILPIEEEAPWPDISACPTSLNSFFALT